MIKKKTKKGTSLY